VLELADYILLMAVNPGFGGQKMIPAVLEKARALRHRIDGGDLDTLIQLDGGLTMENLELVASAGVDIIVAGSSIYHSESAEETTRLMVSRLTEMAERERNV
jgi:ribulose-phosphate 3-epimerase